MIKNQLQKQQKSQNMQKQQVAVTPHKLYPNLKSILHFSHEIPLPHTAAIFSYVSNPQSKKKKKIKEKFDKFTYYQNNQTKQIYKILFLTDNIYIDQGIYPFTEPQGKLKNFKQLVNAKRIKVTQAAYIGHLNDQLIIKKIEGVKLGENGTDFQTLDDQFQCIKIGNQKRFTQFLKLMKLNPNSISMSIRVLIKHSEGEQPEIIDYEFFYRQRELTKKNAGKASQLQKQITK